MLNKHSLSFSAGICLSFALGATVTGQATVQQTIRPTFASATLVFDQYSRVDALVDVNLDGKMDGLGIWETRASKYLADFRAFINDGKANFTVKELITRIRPPNTNAAHHPDVVVADWDGDGNQDFALDQRNGTVVYYASRKAGPAAIGTRAYTQFKAATGIVGADFNGDKKADLAVLTASSLFVYLSSKGTPIVLGAKLTQGGDALRLVDIDKDGAKDLLIKSGASTVLVKVDKGTGAWTGLRQNALRVSTVFESGMTSFHPACGDIDGDGDEDTVLFGADGKYRVLRQVKPGAFVLERAMVGGPATALADIDKDGDLDGICCGGGGSGRRNNYASTFEICLNLGGGRFAPSRRFANIGARHVAGAADMDGDGTVDIVAGRGMLDARLVKSRLFEVQHRHVRPDLPWDSAHVGDHDGDGDIDMIVSGDWPLRNDGSGQFRMEKPAHQNLQFQKTLWGDFDGDGDLDYLVPLASGTSYPTGVDFQMYRNLDGQQYESLGAITPKGALTPSYGRLEVRDMNGDGRDDILTSTAATYLSQGDGTFKKVQNVQLNRLRVRDFNGDGYTDILGYNGNMLSVQFGKSDGTMAAPLSLYDSWSLSSSKNVEVIDSDKDGDFDIWATVGSTLVWFENRGTGTLVKHTIMTDVSSGTALTFSLKDVNGDGLVDAALLWRWTGGSWCHLALQTRPGVFVTSTQAIPQQAGGLADLDADGDLDLAGVRPVTNITFGQKRGLTQQYGRASAGTAGVRPSLGATGPFRVGSLSGLHIRNGRGGDVAMVVSGLQPANRLNYPVQNFNLYVWPTFIHTVVQLGGNSGKLATGNWFADIRLPAEVVGLTLYHQAYLLDPTAPAGLISTNGVRIDYAK